MATTTTNYGLVKPALTDSPPDITAMNPNWDTIDAQLKNNDSQLAQITKYETAGGIATAITINEFTLSDGNSKSFIVASNNNGVATTINNKPLYKPNTTTAPNLIAGKAVTVWYNLSNNCFFIKASAEGDAVAANVLAGKTFSNNDDTGIVGTMPNRVYSEGSSPTSIKFHCHGVNPPETNGNNTFLLPLEGYYNGETWLGFAEPDLIPANIKAGKIIGNDGITITGEFAPKTRNLCRDGSFELGLSHWGAHNAVADTTYKKFGSYSAKLTAAVVDSDYACVLQAVNIISGHKYYACGWFLKSAALTGSLGGQLDIHGGGLSTEMDFAYVDNSTVTSIGTWTFLSGIVTAPNEATSANFRFFTFSANSVWVDGIMLIDLTADFGSGKEPSKVEMDAMLQVNDGFWDSDLTQLTADVNAIANNIFVGKSAYVNGGKLIGTATPKIPNLIKNGNFVDTACWNWASSSFSVGSNVATVTPTAQWGSIAQDLSLPSIGDILYFSCKYYGATSRRVYWGYKASNGFVSNISQTNTWQTISKIMTAPSDMTYSRLVFDDEATSGWTSAQIKEVMFINLTKTFGSGKEPTQAEMDAIIASAGFWDSDLAQLTTVRSDNTFALDKGYWAPNANGNTYARVFLKPLEGYYDGVKWIAYDQPDLLAGNFLATKNIFGLQGSIPVITADYSDQKSAIGITAGPSSGDGKNYAYLQIQPNSYHSGINWIRSEQPDLLATSISSGKTILGIAGTAPRTASGTVTSSSSQISGFTNTAGNSVSQYCVIVSGLTFTPSKIIFIAYANGYEILHVYHTQGTGYSKLMILGMSDLNLTVQAMGMYRADTGSAYVDGTGFRLPVISASTLYSWFAYE